MDTIIITLTDGRSDYDLKFDLLPLDIAQRWVKHAMYFIEAGQPWDDPERFYNFSGGKYDQLPAIVEKLRELVGTINAYAPDLIQRPVPNEPTQDDLNYLHHIFEVYHGLYDQQNTNDFFLQAPPVVQDALGDLNIWVHRCESIGGIPRFVATWKYKPYRDKFLDEDFQYFSLHEEWGDLRINYCEIGKTLYDLWHDKDQYILPGAFVPHHHYCFDFTVRFSDKPLAEVQTTEKQIWEYFDTQQDFFKSLGYSRYDPKLALGAITIAKIDASSGKDHITNMISSHQRLKSIKLL